MKRIAIAIAIATTLLASVPLSAHAVTSGMTEAHIETIRKNCKYAQNSIYRIHMRDALTRVNLGREYETIMTRMMTPMNSRVVLNRLDATSLVGTASSFSDQLDTFRTTYQQYDELVKSVLSINCQNQPVQFYDTLNEAREKRESVGQSVNTLNRLLGDYRSGIDGLRAQLKEEGE